MLLDDDNVIIIVVIVCALTLLFLLILFLVLRYRRNRDRGEVIPIGEDVRGGSSSYKIGGGRDSPRGEVYRKPINYDDIDIGQANPGAASSSGNLSEIPDY